MSFTYVVYIHGFDTLVKVAVLDWSHFLYTTSNTYIQQYCADGATSNAFQYQMMFKNNNTLFDHALTECFDMYNKRKKLVLTRK